MKFFQLQEHAHLVTLLVAMANVFPIPGYVMETMTVETVQMKHLSNAVRTTLMIVRLFLKPRGREVSTIPL